MWDINLKATNEQTRERNKQKLTDTDNSMVVTRGKGRGIVKGKEGQIHSDRRFDFGYIMQYTDGVS